MKQPRLYQPNPVATGLTLLFAIIASALTLLHVTLEGDLSLPTLTLVAGLAVTVMVIVAAGFLAGAGLTAGRADVAGPRARTQEG